MLEQIATSLAISIITGCATYLYGRYCRERALRRGVQAILRYDMLTVYNVFRKRGCTVSEKQSFANMYECYHALGKNGVMTSIYNKVMAMQEVDDEK